MKKPKSGLLYGFIVMLFLTILGFSACSKKSGEATGGDGEKFLTCKLNGQYYEFNYRVNANDKPATDTVHFVVIGGWEKQDMIKGFGIDLTLPEGAKETTYVAAGTTAISLHGKYYIQNMKDGKIVGTMGYNGGTSAGTNFTLTITSLTKWGVKGTFSGKLKLVGGGDEYVTVTEGKFSAPYN